MSDTTQTTEVGLRVGGRWLVIAVAAACWAITASGMQGMDMGPGTASARSAGSPGCG